MGALSIIISHDCRYNAIALYLPPLLRAISRIFIGPYKYYTDHANDRETDEKENKGKKGRRR